MNARIGWLLIALAAIAAPLGADLTGITSTPANLPSEPNEIIVGGGYLWILTVAGNLGRMSPGGAYVEYPLQFGKDQFGFSNARDFAYGPDGNVWISGENGHIERVTPAGAVTDFAALSGTNNATTIVAGADGAMWFFDHPQFGSTSDNNAKLARIDVSGQVTTYSLGLGTDFFNGLVAGGDGNLWFSDGNKNVIVKFSVVTKSVAATYAISSNQSAGAMVAALDGNVWFVHGTSIDRITPDGTITEFPVPSGGQASQLAVGGDGNLWFTEYDSGRIGQLVVPVTSGASATINESAAATVPNPEDILMLPPGFSSGLGKTALDTQPCPPIAFMVKQSPSTPPTTARFVFFSVPQCADIAVGLPVGQQRGPTAERISARIGNNGPNSATAFLIVTMSSFLSSSISSATFANAPAAKCDINQPFPGSVECEVPLQVGEAHDVLIDLTNVSNPAQTGIFTRVSGFSNLPDPDPTNNVQVRFVVLGAAATLPPPPASSTQVATPSVPPGFKPCIVNAGSVGAVGPCFGPPGTTITLLMSQTVPGGPGQLVFKTVASGGPADVMVPVSGSGSVYTATAPPQLCAGPFPHTWNVWLLDAQQGNQGQIGQFSMTNCP